MKYQVLKTYKDGRRTLSDLKFDNEEDATAAIIFYGSFLIANRDIKSYSVVKTIAEVSLENNNKAAETAFKEII